MILFFRPSCCQLMSNFYSVELSPSSVRRLESRSYLERLLHNKFKKSSAYVHIWNGFSKRKPLKSGCSMLVAISQRWMRASLTARSMTSSPLSVLGRRGLEPLRQTIALRRIAKDRRHRSHPVTTDKCWFRFSASAVLRRLITMLP